jgi:hypothetical protein
MTPVEMVGVMQQFEDTIRQADKTANAHEQTGLRVRWQSGTVLLWRRHNYGGRRLPNRMLKELSAALTVHPSELTARTKFAEKFPTEEQLTNVISQFKTWYAIKQKALTDTPREKQVIHPLVRIVTLLEKVDPETLTMDDHPLLTRLEDLVGKLHRALAEVAA